MTDYDSWISSEMPHTETVSCTEHTARKQRSCYACPAPIRAGDRYKREALKVDGVFQIWVRHAVCVASWCEDGDVK